MELSQIFAEYDLSFESAFDDMKKSLRNAALNREKINLALITESITETEYKVLMEEEASGGGLLGGIFKVIADLIKSITEAILKLFGVGKTSSLEEIKKCDEKIEIDWIDGDRSNKAYQEYEKEMTRLINQVDTKSPDWIRAQNEKINKDYENARKSATVKKVVGVGLAATTLLAGIGLVSKHTNVGNAVKAKVSTLEKLQRQSIEAGKDISEIEARISTLNTLITNLESKRSQYARELDSQILRLENEYARRLHEEEEMRRNKKSGGIAAAFMSVGPKNGSKALAKKIDRLKNKRDFDAVNAKIASAKAELTQQQEKLRKAKKKKEAADNEIDNRSS